MDPGIQNHHQTLYRDKEPSDLPLQVTSQPVHVVAQIHAYMKQTSCMEDVCTCISMWAYCNMHVSFLCATDNGEEHAAYPAAH